MFSHLFIFLQQAKALVWDVSTIFCFSVQHSKLYVYIIGRALKPGENGEWGETKQRSENQVAFNCVLGTS
jgi:hypothetical protein